MSPRTLLPSKYSYDSNLADVKFDSLGFRYPLASSQNAKIFGPLRIFFEIVSNNCETEFFAEGPIVLSFDFAAVQRRFRADKLVCNARCLISVHISFS